MISNSNSIESSFIIEPLISNHYQIELQSSFPFLFVYSSDIEHDCFEVTFVILYYKY